MMLQIANLVRDNMMGNPIKLPYWAFRAAQVIASATERYQV